MKKRPRIFLFTIEMVIYFFLCVLFSSAEALAFLHGSTIINNAEIKESPTESSKTLETISPGTTLTLSNNMTDGYFRVRSSKTVGWIKGSSVKAASQSPSKPTKRVRKLSSLNSYPTETGNHFTSAIYFGMPMGTYGFTLGSTVTNINTFGNAYEGGLAFLYSTGASELERALELGISGKAQTISIPGIIIPLTWQVSAQIGARNLIFSSSSLSLSPFLKAQYESLSIPVGIINSASIQADSSQNIWSGVGFKLKFHGLLELELAPAFLYALQSQSVLSVMGSTLNHSGWKAEMAVTLGIGRTFYVGSSAQLFNLSGDAQITGLLANGLVGLHF